MTGSGREIERETPEKKSGKTDRLDSRQRSRAFCDARRQTRVGLARAARVDPPTRGAISSVYRIERLNHYRCRMREKIPTCECLPVSRPFSLGPGPCAVDADTERRTDLAAG